PVLVEVETEARELLALLGLALAGQQGQTLDVEQACAELQKIAQLLRRPVSQLLDPAEVAFRNTGNRNGRYLETVAFDKFKQDAKRPLKFPYCNRMGRPHAIVHGFIITRDSRMSPIVVRAQTAVRSGPVPLI